MEKTDNIIDMREWKVNKNRELFSKVAEEIRLGTLQIHLLDVFSLFAKTDEILYYAIEGQNIDPDSPDYQTHCTKAKAEILRNIGAITEALPQHPGANCRTVQESLSLLKKIAEQIKE